MLLGAACAEPGRSPADPYPVTGEVASVDDADRPLAERVMVGAFTYGGVWRGMEPVLDLGTRLGDGSGAVAAIPLLRMAAHQLAETAIPVTSPG